MKADEIRLLPDDELRTRLDEMKEEYFNLRFRNATGQLENYRRIGLVRKDIARLETIIRERDLGLAPVVKTDSSKRRRWRKTAAEEEQMEARAHRGEESAEQGDEE